ncbi:nuclear pore protein-like protein [Colletotrichum sojae]|uniref:Nuclear pore protein-like protein n=1 Tax=Colletotrichum sojae TaxID=2175907 RepID=A0A8H6MQS1_9PEZI|nr:nuclear pore protein-like protein [Colletotrichum sojae]
MGSSKTKPRPTAKTCDETATRPSETPGAVTAASLIEIPIDSDGDLILRAGSESKGAEKAFRVCSMDLPEDDPRGLKVLLHIVHANFTKVALLKPWADKWLNVAKYLSGTEQSKPEGRDLAKVLYIAWELGQAGLQKWAMNELIVSCHVNADGKMVTDDNVILNDFGPIGPPGLLVILGSFMREMAAHRGGVVPSVAYGKAGESIKLLSKSVIDITEEVVYYKGHKTCTPAAEIKSIVKQTQGQILKLEAAHIEKMKQRRKDRGFILPNKKV